MPFGGERAVGAAHVTGITGLAGGAVNVGYTLMTVQPRREVKMRRTTTLVVLAVIALLVPSSEARANVCAADAVPAATLLFPHVVIDYANPVRGLTTLVVITNMSPEAQIVHVTLWTDYGEPVIDFNIVLAGYDVESFNVRDILINGQLPATGTAGSLVVAERWPPEADGTMQPEEAPWVVLESGQATDTIVDRCPPDDPGYPDHPMIPQSTLELLQSMLQVSQTVERLHEWCDGRQGPHVPDEWFQARTPDDPTYLYITADVVSRCDRIDPDDPRYWQDGDDGRLASQANVLMGEVIWTGREWRWWHQRWGNEVAIADRAVHIEADEDLATVARLDDEGRPVSFYYRSSTLQDTPSDLREPLPTAWAFRYIGWHTDALDTYLRVWKGPTFHRRPVDLVFEEGRLMARDCTSYTYYAWDEHGTTTMADVGGCMGPPPDWWGKWNLVPLMTQEFVVDYLDLADTNGWVLFIWPPSNWAGADAPLPDVFQTWMSVRYAAGQTASAGLDAVVAANASCYPDQVLPGLGVDYDYVGPEGYTTGGGQ